MRIDPEQTTTPATLTTPPPGLYEIDPGHSTVTFATRHLFGLGPVRGRFAVRGGSVDVTEPVSYSGVRAEIDAASFSTGNGQRDGIVRSRRFLDTARHPEIIFISERFGGTALHGTLTVRGVSRPVSLSVSEATVTAGEFTVRATTRIDRTEFGVTASRGLAGRYLDMSLEVRCLRK